MSKLTIFVVVCQRKLGAEILISIHNREKTVTELIKHVGGSISTIEKRLDELINLKLIVQDRQTEFPFRRMFFITQKGTHATKLLIQLIDALEAGR